MDKKKSMIGCLLVLLGIAVGLLLGHGFYENTEEKSEDVAIRLGSGSYTFIDPLLMCAASETTESDMYTPLKDKITQVLAPYQKEGDTASIYYRDLEAGAWFGINESATYAPASLLKLPLAIAYYKYSDTDPTILSKTINYSGGRDLNSLENFAPAESVQPGQSYTIEDLISYMLKDSDNNALNLLDQIMSVDFKNEIYTDLGITEPVTQGDVDFMSVKLYAHFFRVLYNGTYLGAKNSEELLKTLSVARFSSGIAAGIPGSTVLAEKFGERKITPTADTPEKYELHDCGIVYYPEHPYLLCIMSSGTQDFASLSSMIKDISTTIYQDAQGRFQ